MNQSNFTETHKLAEAGMLTVLIVIFALLAIYLPVAWFLLVGLIPIPILIISKRSGIKYAVLACLAATILVGLFSNFIEAISLVPLLLLGIAQELGLRKKISATWMVTLSTGAILVCLVVVFLLSYFLLGINVVAEQTKMTKDYLRLEENLYKSMGYQQGSAEIQALERGLKFLPYVIPASLILFCLIMGLVNFWLTGRILRKLGFEFPHLPEFSHWQWPWYFAWGYILGLVGFLFPRYSGGSTGLVYYLSFDLLVIFGTLFFIQGISILVFCFRKVKLNWVFRGLIIIFLIIFPPLVQILSWVGFLDTWFNYRRLPQQA